MCPKLVPIVMLLHAKIRNLWHKTSVNALISFFSEKNESKGYNQNNQFLDLASHNRKS
jgi:hypothetical protein